MKRYLLIILLIASSALAKDITLQWDAYTDPCQEIRVYRSQGSADWPELRGAIDCSLTQFIDTSVPNGDLSWIITAWDGTKESNASNEVWYAYYYALVRFDYDANQRIIYKGENQDIAAADGDTDWTITKYYYDANGMVLEMRVRVTSWTDRASGW